MVWISAPGPASIDLIVPDTIAALRSMIISEPSDATSLTGSMEPCARAVAFAAFTTDCICGISPIMFGLASGKSAQAPRSLASTACGRRCGNAASLSSVPYRYGAVNAFGCRVGEGVGC